MNGTYIEKLLAPITVAVDEMKAKGVEQPIIVMMSQFNYEQILIHINGGKPPLDVLAMNLPLKYLGCPIAANFGIADNEFFVGKAYKIMEAHK